MHFYRLYIVHNLQIYQKNQPQGQSQVMNLLSFMKNKQDKTKNEKKSMKAVRLDTQAGTMLNKKPKFNQKGSKQQSDKNQKTEKIQRVATNIEFNNQSVSTVYKGRKSTLKIKQLLQKLWIMKNAIEEAYEKMLTGKNNNDNQSTMLLATNYFRFRKATYASVLDEYSNIIQALELLISKLSNNQKLPQTVMIKNQEDFVLFFKVFFSKPYNLINRSAVRKVIKLVWDQLLFTSLTVEAMINNLKLWIFGIASPLNPSMNKLHQYVCENFEQISRFATHKSNQNVYVGVNDSDTLGLTPLMIAVIAKNTKAMEKLVKNGADPSICPLTVNQKTPKSSIDKSKYGGKTMFKQQNGIKERRQPDAIQILRNNKRIDELGQLLCWQNFYQKKVFRKDMQMPDVLELFPNCSFQIDWKQYKGMLCFKELPQDIISVYKKDYFLRIDFHIAGEELQKKEKGHYSLILKAEPKKENQLYFISHNHKFISNILQDKDLQCIKQKYNNILKYGNIYNAEISDINAIFIPEENRLTATIQSYYQNLTKYSMPEFQSLKEYMNEAIKSDFINYAQLEKDQLKAVINQTIFTPLKIKNKIINSVTTVDIEWANESLNWLHLQFLLKIAQLGFPSSLSLNRFKLVADAFEDPVFRSHQFRKKLPLRIKYSFDRDLSIQSEIKNLRYGHLDDSIFKIEVRAKEMNYKQAEEQVDLSHLQDTVYLDEMYSINVSRFVGRSEQILQFEESEANKKFQQLLRLEGIWSNDDEQEK